VIQIILQLTLEIKIQKEVAEKLKQHTKIRISYVCVLEQQVCRRLEFIKIY